MPVWPRREYGPAATGWKLIFGQAQLMAPPELVDEGSVGLWRLKLAPYVTTSTGIDDITIRFD